jgi:hypothetical protein
MVKLIMGNFPFFFSKKKYRELFFLEDYFVPDQNSEHCHYYLVSLFLRFLGSKMFKLKRTCFCKIFHLKFPVPSLYSQPNRSWGAVLLNQARRFTGMALRNCLEIAVSHNWLREFFCEHSLLMQTFINKSNLKM